MPRKKLILEVGCHEVLRELSSYLDGDLVRELRLRIEQHLEHCSHCMAVHNGVLNVVQLLGDNKLMEVPKGFGRRLHERLIHVR